MPAAPPQFAPIEEVIKDIRAGRMVIVTDDEDRENEGDLVMAAEKVTPQRSTSWQQRGLARRSPMSARSSVAAAHGAGDRELSTDFTVSVDARRVSSGTSARPRADDPGARRSSEAADLIQRQPCFPATRETGWRLRRAGHTEATWIPQLAGSPAGVFAKSCTRTAQWRGCRAVKISP
jgi:3,4-dihydroxy 2-butanone 4-phosphate synthase/GTP cyclohydrolase II